jgi:hypothetical protein
VSLKLLPLLLIITVSAASAGGVVMGKPFYRKGDTLVFTLDAMPEPGAAMLMDARGRNLTLTLTFQDGRFIATYTLAPEDPAGRWRLLLKGGEDPPGGRCRRRGEPPLRGGSALHHGSGEGP